MPEKEKNKLTTLSQLSLKLGINKSKLLYYNKLGLIAPITTIGKTFGFDEEKTLNRIKEIQKLQKKEKSIEEIIEIFK